jgi:hypothetical protein
MQKSETVSIEALQDEPFPAEEARADASVERDAHLDAEGGAQEGVFLRDDAVPPLLQVDRQDLAGVRRGERDVAALAAVVRERRDEEGVARERALGSLEQPSHQPRALPARVERGVHGDVVLHVHHRACFRDDGLCGIERHDHRLHVVADQPVVDFVGHGGAVC